MKKYMIFALMIAIIPNYVFGESARYRQLVAEKQRKMAELEQCTGDVNGWKIAGISTLGLTAVGVAGNIALANKQSSLDDKIASTDKQIDKYNSQIETRQGEIMAENVRRSDCQKTGGTYTSAGCQCPDDMDLIGTICRSKESQPVVVNPQNQNVEPKPNPQDNKNPNEGDKNCKVGTQTFHHNDGQNVLNSVECSALKGGFDVANGNICLCTCQNGVANCIVDSCLNGYTQSQDKKKCECDTAKGFEVNNDGKCVKKSDDKGANGNKTQPKDCTDKAKQSDSYVAKAVETNGKCEVTKCESGYTPKTDKTGCELEKTQKKIRNLCLWNGQEQSKDFSLDSVSCDKAPGGWQYVVDERATKCNCSCVENTVNSELYWECKVVACDVANGWILKGDGCVCDAINGWVLQGGKCVLKGQCVVNGKSYEHNEVDILACPLGKNYENAKDCNFKCVDGKEQWSVHDCDDAKGFEKRNGICVPKSAPKPHKIEPSKSDNQKCLEERVAEDNRVMTAEFRKGKCEVTSCKSPFEVSDNKLGCKLKKNNLLNGYQSAVSGGGANSAKNENKPRTQKRITDVFRNTQVNLHQGKLLIDLWGKQNSQGAMSCKNEYKTVSNDDELICNSSSGVEYVFVFDDLSESSARTRNMSIAKTVCEIMGGRKVTEMDTGLGSSIRCDLPNNVTCSGTLNSALRPFGHTAKDKSVYSTGNIGGASKNLAYTYCAISW